MAVLAGLRVQVPTDSLLITAGNRALDLLAPLALADIARKRRLLLRAAILTIADGDG